MTPAKSFKALGVVTVWHGNEDALTLANPAVDLEGRTVVTRGENWTSPDDFSNADVTDDAGFVATDPVDIFEGDVAWLAGPSYLESYETLVRAGFSDRLNLPEWQAIAPGWRIKFGSAADFYVTGAAVASSARQWCEGALVSGRSPESADVIAARIVDTGSPGVARGDRRLADAVWYSLLGDFDLYSRSIRLAARAYKRPEGEIKEIVDHRVDFFRKRVSAGPRQPSRELRRLRAKLAHYINRHRQDQETIKELRRLVHRLGGAEKTITALVTSKGKFAHHVYGSPSNMMGGKTRNAVFHQGLPVHVAGAKGLVHVVDKKNVDDTVVVLVGDPTVLGEVT